MGGVKERELREHILKMMRSSYIPTQKYLTPINFELQPTLFYGVAWEATFVDKEVEVPNSYSTPIDDSRVNVCIVIPVVSECF
jgi:hypothetical protein